MWHSTYLKQRILFIVHQPILNNLTGEFILYLVCKEYDMVPKIFILSWRRQQLSERLLELLKGFLYDTTEYQSLKKSQICSPLLRHHQVSIGFGFIMALQRDQAVFSVHTDGPPPCVLSMVVLCVLRLSRLYILCMWTARLRAYCLW